MYDGVEQRELNKSERLFRYLYDAIRRGELQHGSRLASESELAKAHNCSRITVRSSLRQLQELKLIRRVRGDGTYISSEGVRFSSRRNIALVGDATYDDPFFQGVDPYFSHLMHGLLQNGNTLDFSANFIVVQPRDVNFMGAFARQGIRLCDFDGLIFTRQLTAPELDLLEQERRHFVALQEPCDDREISYAAIDNVSGAHLATSHLLDRGRRELIFFHDSLDIKVNRDKMTGFNRALDEAGIDSSPAARRHYEIDPMSIESGAEAIRRLLDEKQTFDGLIVRGDWAFIGMVNVLREKKIRIPEDVSLILYDDPAIASRVLNLEISHIWQPYSEQLRNALEILTRNLPRPLPINTVHIIQPTLVVRKTS